jgi:type 1 fimbriae regulatory protein FimB/type 1 fimbriae regulatory protein FimE
MLTTPGTPSASAIRALRSDSELNQKIAVGPLRRPNRELRSREHDTRSIQDYLGHKNIQHTVRYTELPPTRFKTFWRV